MAAFRRRHFQIDFLEKKQNPTKQKTKKKQQPNFDISNNI